VAPRLAMPSYEDRQRRAVEDDLDSSGLARAAVEQRRRRHGAPGSDCRGDTATSLISMARLGRRCRLWGKDQALRSAVLTSRAACGRRAARSVIDNTKSEIRGAISARKREPLKTP